MSAAPAEDQAWGGGCGDAERADAGGRFEGTPCTLHPTPQTPHPKLHTLNLQAGEGGHAAVVNAELANKRSLANQVCQERGTGRERDER